MELFEGKFVIELSKRKQLIIVPNLFVCFLNVMFIVGFVFPLEH